MELAAAEAVVVAVLGSTAGLAIAFLVGIAAFGSAGSGASTATAIGWGAGSVGVGLAIAAATVLGPAWRDLRGSTVANDRSDVPRARPPAWARFGFDIVVLVLSGLLFWLARRAGYQIVLAPEGVPTISVSYWAFVAPALLWVGAALLVWRLSDLLLGRGHRWVAAGIRPVAGSLSRVIAHSLSRQRQAFATAIVMLTLSLVFAASTATFNATYRAQAEVDAQLTNGADVTVIEPPGSSVSPDSGKKLSAIRGVQAVEPIQHRFAYIGTDLQDLYGVNPASITSVTALQDNYFRGGTSDELMRQLTTRPDSILVSAETVTDFQLVPGDTVHLRLQDARTHQLTTVAFHYIGVVTEFPTAPKDSFFVANASYVAQQTGSNAVGAFLIDTGGHDATTVAGRVESVVGTSATVSDISTTRGTVGSSLTSVSLQGLTRIELGFGLGLSAAFGALVLALGLAERRRSFAIANALGATRRQLRSFIQAEAAVLIICSLAAGAILSWVMSQMLVSTLSGVFDPPPSALSVPWRYLAVTAITVVLAIGAVSATTARLARRSPLTVLNDL
jgi:putative ABC transport system permease protein